MKVAVSYSYVGTRSPKSSPIVIVTRLNGNTVVSYRKMAVRNDNIRATIGIHGIHIGRFFYELSITQCSSDIILFQKARNTNSSDDDLITVHRMDGPKRRLSEMQVSDHNLSAFIEFHEAWSGVLQSL